MGRSARAVFLDRDGVLNRALVVEGKPYPPRTLGELDIPQDAISACRRLKAAGFLLICVTNQPDVARGLMSRSNLDAINRTVVETLGLDALVACPHSDEDDCTCRKPRPGMLVAAAAAHGVDLCASAMIGDRWRDIEAGRAAGCRTIFIDRSYDEPRPVGMDHVCRSLGEAADYLVRDRADALQSG